MISIIIPVYNAEKYIERCIASIRNQTYARWEAILVDDGSTDHTAAIISRAAMGDVRIKYFYKENGGVSSARNKGLDCARGKYIVFLDADDELMPECLQLVVYGFGHYQADMMQYPHITRRPDAETESVRQRNRPVWKVYSCEEAVKQMLRKADLNVLVWGSAFQRELLENLRFDENISWGEDVCFEYSAVLRSNHVLYCSLPLYVQRLEPGSRTRKRMTGRDLGNVLYAMDEVHALLDGNGKISTILYNYLFGEYMGYLNRLTVEKALDAGWNETDLLLNKMEQMLATGEVSTWKTYAYILWKKNVGVYRVLLKWYYRLRR